MKKFMILIALTMGAFARGPLPPIAAMKPMADDIPKGIEKSDWTSIRAAYEASRHEVRAVDGGHEARNPGLGWLTTWDGQGFLSRPATGGDEAWQWGLALDSYGFAGAEQRISGKPAVHTEGQRLTYQWDANVQEWYVNDDRGLEHGFTVAQRPQAVSNLNLKSQISDDLAFTLRVRGGLRPELSADAQTVRFIDGTGSAVVTYGGLKVWDADGTILPSYFAQAEADRFRLMVDERGARYPLTVDPLAQQAYLKPAAVGSTQAHDLFGGAVAVDGNTVVIGAYREDSSSTGINSTPNESAVDSGAAYVFVRSGSTWTQQAYLKPSNTGGGDDFGCAVSITGDTIIVGACSEDGGNGGINPTSNEAAGDSGAAYIFVRSGTVWTQQAYLKAAVPHGRGGLFGIFSGDQFGSAVSISGNIAVVGAPSDVGSGGGFESLGSGAAYVFTRSGTTWSQQAYLRASNPGYDNSFGGAVAISGETLVVGAVGENSNGSSPADNSASGAGAAYVFRRTGTTWAEQAYLKASNAESRDYFGKSVAISGETIVVGAYAESGDGISPANNNAPSSGAVYVFVRSGSAWTEQAYLKAANAVNFSYFGTSVSISGESVLVGAPSPGAAYAFTREGGSWHPQAMLSIGSESGDYFGGAVAISGNSMVVGSLSEASSSLGINSSPNDLAPNSGAAYTFLLQTTVPSVSTQSAGNLTAHTATLNSKVYAGYSTTTMRFEYGVNPSGPLTLVSPTTPPTVSGNNPGFASYPLTGLTAGQTYRYRAIGQNGVGTTNGAWLTFTTAPAAPTVTTLAANSITSTSAVLNGAVLANGAATDVYFRYFAPGVAGLNQAATPALVTSTTSTPVSASVAGLLPGTTYTFAARASNSVGDAAWTNLTFTTLPDPAVGGLAEPLNVPVAGGGLYGSVIQPDGKTILFGTFTSVHGTAQGRMARLLANGTLEDGLGFNPGANGAITCAAVLADGKIMIGGDFTTLQPRGTGTVFSRQRLARLLSDGTVDTTFGDPGVNAFVLCMAVQPDGAVLVGGDFNGSGSFMGATRNRIARITPAGTLDTVFNPDADGPVYCMVVQTDGNVLLGGKFGFLSSQGRVRIGRVNGSTGLPEPGIGAGSGASDSVYSIALQRDGRAIIGGAFSIVAGIPRNHLARINPDGTLDPTFNPNVTGGDVYSMALQANQKLLVGGAFTAIGGTPRSKVARVDTAGVLDGFNPNVTGGDVLSIALQADGKAQLAGTFTAINGGAAARSSYALLGNETAYQTLEKRSATEVYWSRGGSAPEVQSVAFDQATFSGSTFTALGSGTRVDPLAGDWHLGSISPGLPLSGQIRVRARTSSGYLSGSSGIMESKLAYIHSLPGVTTVSVSEITGTTALLTGTVDTSTLAAVPAFKLDTTTAYTQPLRIATPASVTGTATFTYQVTGLVPGTAYVFRATAENPGGRVDGTDINFTTLSNLNVVYNTGAEIPTSGTNYTATGRNVTFALNYHPTPGTALMVVNNTGSLPITGSFANLGQGQVVNLTFSFVTYPFVAHYHGGTGNDLVLLWRNTRAVSWGWNSHGQLGNGNSTNLGAPVDVASGLLTGKTIVALSGGTSHSVALCVDGTIATWGNNLEGQLGTGDDPLFPSSVPTAVETGYLPANIHPVAISAGGSHTLSLFSNGRVYAWGDNQYGQVGNSSAPSDSSLPAWAKGVLSGKRVIGISAGEHHSLAVCDDGTVAAWGRGEFGQLGMGSNVDQSSPVAVDLTDVPLGEKFVAVAAGRWHSMALTSGGKIFTWGRNTEGQLGNGAAVNQSFPILVPGLTASAIYGGGTMHSLARRNDGKLVSWGSNTFGQLGTGGFANSSIPTQVNDSWQSAQSLVAAVSGDEHNLALRSDGTLYAWGLGNEGRLGDDNIGIHTQPMQIPVITTLLDPGDRWQSLYSGAVSQHSLGIVAVSLQPSATTLPAVLVSDTEAILYGQVNAHGISTDFTFDHGLNTSYGATTAASTLDGITPARVSSLITGLLPGHTYHFRVKARRAGFITLADDGDDLTFTTRSRLEMWRQQWYETYENTGNAANDADPDRDGINNLLEFAFGLDPRENSSSQLPAIQHFPGLMTVSFTEPNTYMGVTYGAEWSTTMAPLSWQPLPDNGSGTNHVFKLNTTGLNRAFFRLKVTDNEP